MAANETTPKRKAASKTERPRPGLARSRPTAGRHARRREAGARRASGRNGPGPRPRKAVRKAEHRRAAPTRPATAPGRPQAVRAARQGARRRPRSPASAASCPTTSGCGQAAFTDDRLISSARAGHDELRTPAQSAHRNQPRADGRRHRREVAGRLRGRRRGAGRRQPDARSGPRRRHRQGARRELRRRRGAEGRRRNRRARPASLGARSGLVGRLAAFEQENDDEAARQCGNPLLMSSFANGLIHHRQHPLDDCLNVHVRGVDVDRVVGAIVSGDAARVRSERSRASSAWATPCTSPFAGRTRAPGRSPGVAPALRATRPDTTSRRRAGNTTVPMSRPSMTSPPSTAYWR